jgi:hypothetical protein
VLEDYGGELEMNLSGAAIELVVAVIEVDNASSERKRDAMVKTEATIS